MDSNPNSSFHPPLPPPPQEDSILQYKHTLELLLAQMQSFSYRLTRLEKIVIGNQVVDPHPLHPEPQPSSSTFQFHHHMQPTCQQDEVQLILADNIDNDKGDGQKQQMDQEEEDPLCCSYTTPVTGAANADMHATFEQPPTEVHAQVFDQPTKVAGNNESIDEDNEETRSHFIEPTPNNPSGTDGGGMGFEAEIIPGEMQEELQEAVAPVPKEYDEDDEIEIVHEEHDPEDDEIVEICIDNSKSQQSQSQQSASFQMRKRSKIVILVESDSEESSQDDEIVEVPTAPKESNLPPSSTTATNNNNCSLIEIPDLTQIQPNVIQVAPLPQPPIPVPKRRRRRRQRSSSASSNDSSPSTSSSCKKRSNVASVQMTANGKARLAAYETGDLITKFVDEKGQFHHASVSSASGLFKCPSTDCAMEADQLGNLKTHYNLKHVLD